MKNIKPKLQTAGRFILENGDTIIQCIIFLAGFLKALAESERKPRR